MYKGVMDCCCFTSVTHCMCTFVLPRQPIHAPFTCCLQAPPSPPSTSRYVGMYAGSGQTALIEDYQSSLVIRVNGLNVYLAYISEGVFRIYLPYQLVPCMQGELLAYTGEWVYFSNLQNNMYHTMTVPGFRYNVQLTRQ